MAGEEAAAAELRGPVGPGRPSRPQEPSPGVRRREKAPAATHSPSVSPCLPRPTAADPPGALGFLSPRTLIRVGDAWRQPPGSGWCLGGHSRQAVRSPPLAPLTPRTPKCCGGWREAHEGGGRCQGTRAPGCAARTSSLPSGQGPHIPSSRPPLLPAAGDATVAQQLQAVPTPGPGLSDAVPSGKGDCGRPARGRRPGRPGGRPRPQPSRAPFRLPERPHSWGLPSQLSTKESAPTPERPTVPLPPAPRPEAPPRLG